MRRSQTRMARSDVGGLGIGTFFVYVLRLSQGPCDAGPSGDLIELAFCARHSIDMNNLSAAIKSPCSLFREDARCSDGCRNGPC